MKAVPKVNTDGLYIEDTLVDDTFSGVVPFYAPEPEPEPLEEIEVMEEGEEKEPEIAGHIVGVPVPQGLFRPRFDLMAWEAREEGDTSDQSSYWIEGLTPEEIEALRPEPEPTPIEILQAEVVSIKEQAQQQQESNINTDQELSMMKQYNSENMRVVDTLGAEQVKQDLSALDLKRQNDVLGAELVKKDIALLDLYNQNRVLGQMVAALELKILANGTGGETNV